MAWYYALFSSLWIVASDLLVYHNHDVTPTGAMLSIGKGLLFVLVTTVLIHLYIRRSLKSTLSERDLLKQRLHEWGAHANDIIVLFDDQARVIEVNERAVETFGYKAEKMTTLGLMDLVADQSAAREGWQLVQEHGVARARILARRADGTVFPTEHNSKRIDTADGMLVQSIVRDMTESEAAEQQIVRLKDMYAALSQTNECIARTTSQEDLFRATCEIAVSYGHFKMALIGLIDEANKEYTVAASAGDADGYLEEINLTTDADSPMSRGPFARTIQTGRPVLSSQLQAADLAPWRERWIQHGIGAAAAFPLLLAGSPVGALLLYSQSADFFTPDLTDLLEEMARDISFAMEVYSHEQERARLAADTVTHLRELQILNEMNKALLDADSEKELLQAYCRIAVETAGYRMAWVGFAAETPEKLVVPVAWAGHEEGLLSIIKVTWDGGELSQGPTGRALRSGQIEVTKDVALSAEVAPFLNEVTARGYRSGIAIPFHTDPGSMACLTVYSGEPIDWSQAERHLMQQVASALGYGIRTLRGAIAKEQYLGDLRDSLERTVELIAETVDRRDPYTAGHQRRVAELSVRIARKLGLDEERLRGLRLAATIHDLGKIGIPAELLVKPSKLSKAEFTLIKEHSQIGYEIVKNVSFPWPIASMIRQHHERMNGTGYPDGIRGEAILLESRILAVADVVEAMVSHRPYRPARGVEVALDELLSGRGDLYDPAVVDACITVFREEGFTFTY